MSTRRRRSSSEVKEAQNVLDSEKSLAAPVAEMPVAELKAVPEAEVKAGPDYIITRFDGIDSKLETLDEKIKPVDLKGIEDKVMASNVASGEVSKRLDNVEKELRMFNTFFKAVLGVGAVGVILIITVILRLTGHL